MHTISVKNYEEMSYHGAKQIHDAVMEALEHKGCANIGLATGNTMLDLYQYLAKMFNAEKADLSGVHTWNLDEYAATEHSAVSREHPLSYWKYMHKNLFNRFLPKCGFKEENAHFPNPADTKSFDDALAAAGGLDFQLLGIGFNGHIAFNEPMPESMISARDFAVLPSRVIALKERTIETNAKLTAPGGTRNVVPRYAATMGMKQILQAKKILLLACFAEQEEPLRRMITDGKPTPELPASYLLTHPNSAIVYTADKIKLDSGL